MEAVDWGPLHLSVPSFSVLLFGLWLFPLSCSFGVAHLQVGEHLQVFPHDEAAPDSSHCSDFAVLGDYEPHAFRIGEAVAHHRSVARAVMVRIHPADSPFVWLRGSRDEDTGWFLLRPNLYSKPFDPKFGSCEDKAIHT